MVHRQECWTLMPHDPQVTLRHALSHGGLPPSRTPMISWDRWMYSLRGLETLIPCPKEVMKYSLIISWTKSMSALVLQPCGHLPRRQTPQTSATGSISWAWTRGWLAAGRVAALAGLAHPQPDPAKASVRVEDYFLCNICHMTNSKFMDRHDCWIWCDRLILIS